MLSFLEFVFNYVNDREPMLIAEAITAYYNQKSNIQPESAGKEVNTI
tara:strand:+ start:4 stop:144 length:141 start_codon:yes stop_codon:yes gene_type:complete